MKKTLLSLVICVAGWQAGVWGQDSIALQRAVQWNAIAKPGSTVEWLKLRDDTRFTAHDFFEKNSAALGLSKADEMRLTNTRHDELGMEHHRFQQYHQGYKIYGAEYVLHGKKGRIANANGKLFTAVPKRKPEMVMTVSEALDKALEQMVSKRFLWNDSQAESNLQTKKNDAGATYYPTGELVWVSLHTEKQAFIMAWKFDIFTSDGTSERLFVDAGSGVVIKRVALDINCDPGTGTTIWNGTVNINTDQPGPNFILLDDCQSPNIHVYNGNDSSNVVANRTEYADADNSWNQPSAIQTFFGLRQAWQYFLNTYGRDSYDDAGADMIGYNQAGFINSSGNLYFSNAQWRSSIQSWAFGDHGTNNPANDDWNSVDIVGHEFTHGVTEHSAGLDYESESGALNESFSDIFGEMVEFVTDGSMDWQVGGDRAPGAIRSFTAPNTGNQPDTYQGTNWIAPSGTCDGTNDFCGVHTNSGVQNYWFYLLSVGGSDSNDNGELYNVGGIGATSAAAIAYRNLTVYLGNSSTFSDAKNGAIQAAEDLFGECSNEVLQCARAWNAVGVNSSDLIGYDLNTDCPTLDLLHNAFLPVHYVAFNDIRSACNILPNSTSVELEAGHAVVLQPGFRSGDNFHAFLNPCNGTKPIRAAENRQNGQPLVSKPGMPEAKNGMEVFPNPFSTSFSVRFHLAEAAPVSLQLSDAFGKLIHRWYAHAQLEAGEHLLNTDQLQLAPGIYFVEMNTPDHRGVQKLVKVSQ